MSRSCCCEQGGRSVVRALFLQVLPASSGWGSRRGPWGRRSAVWSASDSDCRRCALAAVCSEHAQQIGCGPCREGDGSLTQPHPGPRQAPPWGSEQVEMSHFSVRRCDGWSCHTRKRSAALGKAKGGLEAIPAVSGFDGPRAGKTRLFSLCGKEVWRGANGCASVIPCIVPDS